MLWTMLAIIGLGGLTALFEKESDMTIDKYCKLECKENRIGDCSICC